jgi:hypothetical protein
MKVDPELYTKYLRQENGKDVMYVKLAKALHGTLQVALLFWKNLSSYLISEGFKLNPYDNCVVNKMTKGAQQCTVLWHVDNLKLSHIAQWVLEELVTKLNGCYGEIAPLTVTRGTKHDYLGMMLDYSMPSEVMIWMDDYISDLLEEALQDMARLAATPAGDHLFKISKDPEYLGDSALELFQHHLTAKLLFLCKQAQLELQTAVAFLTTQVKCPDTNDYVKLM